MNRNGNTKLIQKRMNEPGYTLEQALRDLDYLIDYARGLEDDFRAAMKEAADRW